MSYMNTGQFWEVSYDVLFRIEGNNYIENKVKHNQYLWFNPYGLRCKEEICQPLFYWQISVIYVVIVFNLIYTVCII